ARTTARSSSSTRTATSTTGRPELGLLPHRHLDVAEVDAACRANVEIVVPVGADLEIVRELRAFGVHIFVGRALCGRHVACETDARDRHILRFVLVEAECLGPAGK